MPLMIKPIRITDDPISLIYNLLTTTPQHSVSGFLTFDISDNFPVFPIFENLFVSEKLSTVINYRLGNEVSPTKFCENLIDYDLETIIRDGSCDVSINKIYDLITKEFDRTCPIVTRRLKRKGQERP